MIAAFLRLFALRPLLAGAIFGIPLLLVIAVGLFTIWTIKILVFVVLPIAAAVWIVRSLFCSTKDES